MAVLALCLSFVFAIGGAVTMGKIQDQVMRDKNRRTYRLAFPSDLDPERVTAWLRALSGTLRARGVDKMFGGSPTLTLEVWATNEGITHRIKMPWQYEPYIRPKLESLIPGIRLVAEEECPVRVWVHAVEAGLKAGHRPLRISAASDVSTSVLANFSTMAEGESLMMQWVIAPAVPEHKPLFGEAASRENTVWSLITGSVATRDEIQDRRDKLDEPNMLAVLRVAAVAHTPVRAQFMVRGVMSTLDATRGPATRFYKRLATKEQLQKRIDRAATPLNLPVQLSAPELTAVIGWPLGNPLVAGLPAAVSRYLPAPVLVPSQGRVLGESNYPGRERKIAVSYKESMRHVYILGGTGSGKSSLMANMMKQDMERGHGLVLIEGKGDLFRQALDYVPPNRVDDVVVFDVSDEQRPVGWNILCQGDPAIIVDELNMVFNRLFSDHPSLWMQEVLFFALRTLTIDKNATFIDLPALVSPGPEDLAWRDNLVRKVTDPQVKNFWQRFDNQARTRQDQKAEPLLSRVWPMTRSKLINIVGQSESSFYMDDIVRENKILLVNLSGIETGAQELMGTLLMNSLWTSVKTLHSKRGMFLYLDELHRFLNIPVDLEQMLVESRSMGLGMVLAHQYLGQLPSADMEQAIMSNARTKVVFQLGSSDARSIVNNFGSTISTDDLQHLAQFEAIARVSTDAGLSIPLSMQTLPPAKPYGLANKVLYESRGKYGRPIQEVQEQIYKRRSEEQVPRRPRRSPRLGDEWGGLASP